MRFLNLENVLNYYCTRCQLPDNLGIVFICPLWPLSPKKVFKTCCVGGGFPQNTMLTSSKSQPAQLVSWVPKGLSKRYWIFLKRWGKTSIPRKQQFSVILRGWLRACDVSGRWPGDVRVLTYKYVQVVQLRHQWGLWIEPGTTEIVRAGDGKWQTPEF